MVFRDEVAFNHGSGDVDCCFERATTVILAGTITHVVVSWLDSSDARNVDDRSIANRVRITGISTRVRFSTGYGERARKILFGDFCDEIGPRSGFCGRFLLFFFLSLLASSRLTTGRLRAARFANRRRLCVRWCVPLSLRFSLLRSGPVAPNDDSNSRRCCANLTRASGGGCPSRRSSIEAETDDDDGDRPTCPRRNGSPRSPASLRDRARLPICLSRPQRRLSRCVREIPLSLFLRRRRDAPSSQALFSLARPRRDV